ncbi:MAG: hypothetical protein J4F42_10570, partial [Desulfurellaceae bacterium]|nr:hypothetical protein [Desulfurellaceae bacterium]
HRYGVRALHDLLFKILIRDLNRPLIHQPSPSSEGQPTTAHSALLSASILPTDRISARGKFMLKARVLPGQAKGGSSKE